MRFMVIVKASSESESGAMPSEKDLAEMGRYNEELAKAGIMLAGEGLLASSKGARVQYGTGKPRVVDGPFTETKELVAGFWILQCKSMGECLEWVKRAPFREGEVEVRQIAEAADFGEAYTDEVRKQEDSIRRSIESRK